MTPDASTPPRYFEDYVPGTVATHGPTGVTEAELVDFARRYDPQPLHVDVAAAAAGPFGGLIASGWHTASLTMRLLARHFLSPATGLGSPGIDELRWLAPVRPGDALTVRTTVLEARRSAAKPERGLVRTLIEVDNQDGTTVMSMKAMTLIRCRGEQPA